MARVEITHKCVMIARNAARKDSDARKSGMSVFIKRYYGKYRLLAVRVSREQRNCRDMFAEAQKMAHKELENWNRKRHWEREARKHKVKGAHRMAVKAFYKMLKEGGEEKRGNRLMTEQRTLTFRDMGIMERDSVMTWEKKSERKTIKRERRYSFCNRYRLSRIEKYEETGENSIIKYDAGCSSSKILF